MLYQAHTDGIRAFLFVVVIIFPYLLQGNMDQRITRVLLFCRFRNKAGGIFFGRGIQHQNGFGIAFVNTDGRSVFR